MEINYFDFIKKIDIDSYKIFIVTGDEPLQKHNVIEKVIDTFKNKSFEVTRHEISDQSHECLYHEADSLSLFAMDKLIQYTMEKPPQKSLQQGLMDNILKPSDNVYLLVFNNLKKQSLSTKWFKSLEQNSLHVHIYQSNMSSAINIIKNEISNLDGLTLSNEAIQILAQKTEGNLIATNQILKLLHRQNTLSFDEQTIRPFLHEHSSYDVFDLSDAILHNQRAKALNILNSILVENDKPPLVLWMIKRELRIISQLQSIDFSYHQKIFKTNNIWASKQKYYSSMANRVSMDEVSKNLEECLKVDLCIKGAQKGNIKLMLNEIIFHITKQ